MCFRPCWWLHPSSWGGKAQFTFLMHERFFLLTPVCKMFTNKSTKTFCVALVENLTRIRTRTLRAKCGKVHVLCDVPRTYLSTNVRWSLYLCRVTTSMESWHKVLVCACRQDFVHESCSNFCCETISRVLFSESHPWRRSTLRSNNSCRCRRRSTSSTSTSSST